MSRHSSPWPRGVAAALVAFVGLAVAAPPAVAAELPLLPQKPLSLAMAAEARVAASAEHAVSVAPVQEAAGGGASESKPFFKSGKGIAAMLLMVGATAWVIASRTGGDVVHSPGKK